MNSSPPFHCKHSLPISVLAVQPWPETGQRAGVGVVRRARHKLQDYVAEWNESIKNAHYEGYKMTVAPRQRLASIQSFSEEFLSTHMAEPFNELHRHV